MTKIKFKPNYEVVVYFAVGDCYSCVYHPLTFHEFIEVLDENKQDMIDGKILNFYYSYNVLRKTKNKRRFYNYDYYGKKIRVKKWIGNYKDAKYC